MWILVILPFALQAVTIGIDEVWFHWKRGLPKWERIGHPVDTFTVLLCMGYVLFVPFSKQALLPYCLLSAFSCVMVTKDEFIHKEHCSGAENWFHAVLFLLHPITLASAGLIWPVSWGVETAPWIASWLTQTAILTNFLKVQFFCMFLFMLYQIVFWNFVWKDRPVLKH